MYIVLSPFSFLSPSGALDTATIHPQGNPHFRRFHLTSDLTRLTWESAKKVDATVLISQITEIKFGQKTPNFKRRPLPECEVGVMVVVVVALISFIRTRTHTHTFSVSRQGRSPSCTLAAPWILSAKTRGNTKSGPQDFRSVPAMHT